MTLHTLQFGDAGQVATREMLQRFDRMASRDASLVGGRLAACLRAFETLDRQSGGSGALALEDAGDLVAAALTELARLEQDARRGEPGRQVDIAELALGVALWAMRHEVALDVAEPVANALAVRSNLAATRQELAAVFGLMQGVIAYVAPRLGADLERSNPERPWRILHANFAITAIRTEDPQMMAFAFDALDAALPDERAGFYAEALALALAPGIAPAVREAIEARHLRYSGLPASRS